MKKVSLKSVRESFKSVNNGSMFSVIKAMYAVLTDENGKVSLPKELKGVLPANKKQALNDAQSIIEWGKVGEERIIKRTNKVTNCVTEIHATIKPSADMVLRYYVAKANGNI